MNLCSGVDAEGPAAMACLQQNASSLSPSCQAAVSQAAVVLRALLLLRVRLFLLVPVFPPAPPVLLALNRLRSHPRPRRKRMSHSSKP